MQGSCLPLQQMRWPGQRSRMAFWKVCIAGIRWPDSAERRYQRHIDEHRVFNHRRSKQQSCQHQYQSRTPCTWILDVELSHSDAPTPVVATRLNNPFEPWLSPPIYAGWWMGIAWSAIKKNGRRHPVSVMAARRQPFPIWKFVDGPLALRRACSKRRN